MRTLAALTLFVSSVAACYAEDWTSVHRSGREAVQKHDYETACVLFQRSVPLAANDTQKALSSNDAGVVLHQMGRDSEAKGWLEQALAEWKKASIMDDRYAQTAAALAGVYRLEGNYSDSEALLRQTSALKDVNADLRGYVLTQWGDILREQGRFSEARPPLQRAASLSGVSGSQVVNTAIAMAELDRDAQNFDASVDEWNRALSLASDRHVENMQPVIVRGLGQTWLDRGNLERGEPLLRKALALFEAEPQRDEGQIATTLASLGELYLAEDKLALAEDALDRALAGDERTLGPAHPQVAVVLETLADTVAMRSQTDLARNYMERAEKIMLARFGEHSAATAVVYANWGALEERMKNPTGAADRFRKALDTLPVGSPDVNPMRTRIVEMYAGVLKSTHHKREAAELLASTKCFQE
jgi:tetratricopeptide (TPR) repeat protein